MDKEMNNLTCVSGYWQIKNKHGNAFKNWFNHTLKINCPYVFFGDKDSIETIKKYRGNLPTHYIECNIEDFTTYEYKDRMITHSAHCPSVELNLIWNEKTFLIEKASRINPFSSEYFMWIDAGICVYRDRSPPKNAYPDIDKLNKLPKDKVIYTSSGPYEERLVAKGNYYHHVSGGSYILHRNIIDTFSKLYKQYLDKLIDKNNIWTEQVVLTHIFKDHKELFHKLCDGYGKIVPLLY